jgi:hypothetical protein
MPTIYEDEYMFEANNLGEKVSGDGGMAGMGQKLRGK